MTVAEQELPRRLNPYQRLVYDTVKAQGLSYAEVARRSGGLLSRQRVQQVVEVPITQNPKPDTIRGLAKGLGLSEDTIREAITETLGLRVLRSASTGELRRITDAVERLPAPDQERWLRLAQALLKELRAHPS